MHGMPQLTRSTGWILVGVALLIALSVAYAGVVQMLVEQWWSNSMYSHSFLIPIISGYVVWTGRDRIAAAWGPASYRAGIPALAMGLLLLVMGSAGSIAAAQQVSLLPSLAGLVLLTGGTSLLRAVWFPLLYLLFMIPIWDVFTERMHLPFQMLSATLGTQLLHLVGVPAYRSDTFVYLPDITLEVAQVCSGVNYLIALAAIAVPLTYMSTASLARRVLVVAIGVAVAILSNGLRVALIGVTLYTGISHDIHGPGHIFHGMFVALAGYAALFAAARLLGTSDARSASTPGQQAALVPARVGGEQSWRALACGVAMILAALLLQPTIRAAHLTPGREISSIPFQVGAWKAVPGRLEDTAVRSPRADQEIIRSYAAEGMGTVHLYIAYYASQAQGRELIGYRSTTQGEGVPVALDFAAINHEAAAETLTDTAGKKRLVITWYDVNGRVTADPWRAKLLTIWDGLRRGRTNGALVAITAEPPSPSAAVSTDEVLTFVRGVVPGVGQYLAAGR